MKTYFKILFMLLFIAIQAIDIAFLDANEANASEVHTDLGIDYDVGGASHDIHCGCDSLHHLYLSLESAESNNNLFSSLKPVSSDFVRLLANGPPLPPPTA